MATASATPAETSTVNASPGDTEEVVLPIPPGSIAPAVFYDTEPGTPQQQAALEKIGSEFEENVSKQVEGVTEAENWDTARKIADQRYLTLFGYQAYNQHHLQAAKEAVKEKKTLATPAPTAP